MTQTFVPRRILGVVLGAALLASAVMPAHAQRIPMGQDVLQPVAEQVGYRRGPRAKRARGNQALGAAAIIGAIGIGAALIANSQQRERVYYSEPQYVDPYAGYQPQYYEQQPVYQQEYYQQPHYVQPRIHRRAAPPAVDSGSVYAVLPRSAYSRHYRHGY